MFTLVLRTLSQFILSFSWFCRCPWLICGVWGSSLLWRCILFILILIGILTVAIVILKEYMRHVHSIHLLDTSFWYFSRILSLSYVSSLWTNRFFFFKGRFHDNWLIPSLRSNRSLTLPVSPHRRTKIRVGLILKNISVFLVWGLRLPILDSFFRI